MKKTYNRFRNIALAEGISFLALLLVAMPLKYFANFPMAVTIMGSIHGILFVAFMIFAWEVRNEYKKDMKWLLLAFLASILPFGTFYMDHKYWKPEASAAA
jgi:integral membrane protein